MNSLDFEKLVRRYHKAEGEVNNASKKGKDKIAELQIFLSLISEKETELRGKIRRQDVNNINVSAMKYETDLSENSGTETKKPLTISRSGSSALI